MQMKVKTEEQTENQADNQKMAIVLGSGHENVLNPFMPSVLQKTLTISVDYKQTPRLPIFFYGTLGINRLIGIQIAISGSKF